MSQSDLEEKLCEMERGVSRHEAVFRNLADLFDGGWPSRDDLIKTLRDGVWSPTYQDWVDERNNASARANERDDYARRLTEAANTIAELRAEIDALKETLEQTQRDLEARNWNLVELRKRNRLLCPEHTSGHATGVMHKLADLLSQAAAGQDVTTAAQELLTVIVQCDGWHIAFGPREVIPRTGAVLFTDRHFLRPDHCASNEWSASTCAFWGSDGDEIAVLHRRKVPDQRPLLGGETLCATTGVFLTSPASGDRYYCLACLTHSWSNEGSEHANPQSV